MNIYTAVMVLCMVSPVLTDMTGHQGNCISPAKPIDFGSIAQCDFYMAQVRRRLSARMGIEDIFNLNMLPTMKHGRLKMKGTCSNERFNDYLQCVDCELYGDV